MAKKLIVYITTFYPTVQKPWHGIFFRDHAEALAEYEDVAVMHLQVPSFKQARSLQIKETTKNRNGVYTVQIRNPVLTHRFSGSIRRAYSKAAQTALKKIVEYNGKKPDFLVAQCVLPAGMIARHLSKEKNIPYGVIDHFSFLDNIFNEQEKEVRAVYRDAHFLAAVSDEFSDTIREFISDDQNVINVGNVLGRQFEHQQPVNISSNAQNCFKWLFVGPDQQKKGTDILQKALLQLENTDWQLTIVGQGEFNHLKQASYGQKITHFTQLSRTEMVQCMQKHHALVSTSRKETFGMALLEMLSQGRPVVATRCAGPKELINQQNGLLTDIESPTAVATAMSQLMDNYDSYQQAKIRQSAIDNFGSRAFYGKFKQALSQ